MCDETRSGYATLFFLQILASYKPISFLSDARLIGFLHGGGGSSIVKVPGDVPPTRVYFSVF